MPYDTTAISTDEASVSGCVTFRNSYMLSGLGRESNIIVIIIMLSEQINRVEAEVEEEERQ